MAKDKYLLMAESQSSLASRQASRWRVTDRSRCLWSENSHCKPSKDACGATNLDDPVELSILREGFVEDNAWEKRSTSDQERSGNRSECWSRCLLKRHHWESQTVKHCHKSCILECLSFRDLLCRVRLDLLELVCNHGTLGDAHTDHCSA